MQRIAIHYLPRPKGDPVATLRRIVGEKWSFLSVGELGADALPVAPFVVAGMATADELSPPDAETVRYFGRGLSPGDGEAVQKSELALATMFSGAGRDRLRVLRAALEVMLAVAAETGGLIWDHDSRELYSSAAWNARVARWTEDMPLAQSLFTIHTYRDGELFRMVSIGLGRFGLPDLVVDQVAGESADAMGSLINVTAQTLLQGGAVEEGGRLAIDLARLPNQIELLEAGTGRATVTLTIGQRQEGDADNRLWEITFSGDATRGVQAQQDAFLSAFFGSKDEVARVTHDDELEEASRRARARLISEVKPRFTRGLADMEHLLVKAPFQIDGGGNEWMWIEVVSWQGKTIGGVLSSDPSFVKGLAAGDRVQTNEDDVFDYIYRRADGSVEGNTTADILLRQQAK
jgi:uncharacterized protein YegJ (DUF2314 family)